MTELATRPVVSAPTIPAALYRAWPALAAYAVVRLLSIGVLAVWAGVSGSDATQLLASKWDSVWYSGIAEHGYGHTVYLPNGDVHSDVAFFPLLPGLERLMAGLSPLTASQAGLAISAISSLAAVWGIFTIGDRLYSRRVGVLLVVLWAALPTGIVASMAYSEALFTALAAWTLYNVLAGRWVWAGCLAVLAGLTRPSGAAVVAAVVIAGVLTVLGRSASATDERRSARVTVGILIAPLGWLGYVVWVGYQTHDPLGYLRVQGSWGNGFDGGWAFGRFTWDRLTTAPFVAGLGLVVLVTLVAWLYAVGVRQGQPLVLLVYSGLMLVLTLGGSGYFGSKPRLLMPAFPLLLPIALTLARSRPTRTAITLVCCTIAAAGYGALWLTGSGPP